MKKILLLFSLSLLFNLNVFSQTQRRINIQDYATVSNIQTETQTPAIGDKICVKSISCLFIWDPVSVATHDGLTVIKQNSIATGRFILVNPDTKWNVNGNDIYNINTGNVGIGQPIPTAKLHVKTGVANTSGVRLENLTSTSPTTTGQAIGVDATGNVVTVLTTSAATIQQLNATGNVTAWNSVVEIGATPLTANTVITLPTAAANIGKTITFKRLDNTAFTVSIIANGVEVLQLNGSGSELSSQYGALTIQAVSATKSEQVSNIGIGPVIGDWSGVVQFSANTNTNLTTVVSTNTANFGTLITTANRVALTGATVTGGMTVNAANGTIAIAKSGSYSIVVSVNTQSAGAASQWGQLVKNNATILSTSNGYSQTASAGMQIVFNYTGNFIAGDLIDVRLSASSAGTIGITGYSYSVVQGSGYLPIMGYSTAALTNLYNNFHAVTALVGQPNHANGVPFTPSITGTYAFFATTTTVTPSGANNTSVINVRNGATVLATQTTNAYNNAIHAQHNHYVEVDLIAGTTYNVTIGGSVRDVNDMYIIQAKQVGSTATTQFSGATAITNGTAGFVPAPLAGQEGNTLLGDGTWGNGSVRLSNILAAGAVSTIDNTNFAQNWNWSTTTTGTPFSLSANALTTGTGLSLTTSNASLASTNGFLNVANTGAATGTTPFVRLQPNSTAGSGINLLNNGNVGIGTATPTTPLEVNGEIKGTRIIANGAGAIVSNVAVGGSSLIANTTGTNNTAVGFQALFGATTGSNSVAIGGNALQAITTGNNNVAIGSQALRTNTVGSSNTAIGGFALVTGTGNSNVAIGHNSQLAATTALQNVSVGANTLFNNTTGGNNTVIGHGSGVGIVTGGSNTIIGANVTGLASGLSGNIIIADGGGNQRINVDGTGNVGIGTTTPTTKLHIVSTATSILTAEGSNTNSIIEINNTNASATNYTGVRMNKNGVEQWLIGTSGVNANGDFAIRRPALVPFTILQSNGNVGIGTTSPTATLHVNGTFTTQTSLVKANQTANFAIPVADVDAASMILYNQSTAGISITSIATPSSTTIGRFLRIHNFGTAALTYLGDAINPSTFLDLHWNGGVWAKETSSSGSSVTYGIGTLANIASGTTLGTASTTVDLYDYINVPQTTNALVLTLANPTLTTTPRKVTIVNTSTATTTTLNGVGFVGKLIFEWNGTTWSYIGGAESDHVLVRQAGVEATNATAGHHVAYTVATTSSGSTIVADLTTAYSTSTNAASRGRFTLQPGHTYILRGVLGLTTNNGVQWAWFNSDANTQIGGATTQGFSASQAIVESSITVASVPIRVELRMVTTAGSYNVGNWENHAYIKCLK